MIFASFEFLFLFLPLFFAGYYLTPTRLRNWPILLFSWAFYAWWRVDFLALLMCVTIGTYVISRFLQPRVGTPAAKPVMILGIAANLAVLAYFKYANFGVHSLNGVIGVAGFAPVPWANIVLPAGLSFYVLQSVSYLIDVYWGKIQVSRSLLNYAAYKAMFSQLIAGPIVRYAQIAEELKRREHSLAIFGLGARRFMIGFCMKVIIADTLSPLVDVIFAMPRPTFEESWLGAVTYTLQLYFDFAGYSVMAIGLALMIGFHFPENFRNPYLSRSTQDFWNRWHITLSSFLRDYLYIPLGGNRKGLARTYVNLMLTMLIGGFWHGANWTFIVWGAWQGLTMCIVRWYGANGGKKLPYALANAMTMLVAIVGWVVFRAADLGSAGAFYAGMLGLHGSGITDALAWQFTPDRAWMIVIGVIVIYLPLITPRIGAWVKQASGAPGPVAAIGQSGMALCLVGPLCGFLLGMVLLYSRAAVPFLYFQF